MDHMICYCFNYTYEDIRQDVLKNEGRSMIMERIVAAKIDHSCQCALRHPKGR